MNMNKKLLKNLGIYAGILLLFIGLAYGFTPEVFEGKIVNQGDISQWKGMANEAMTHNEAHPEDPTAWSNAMFGGMPTTSTIDSFEGDWTDAIYDFLLTGRRPASYLLLALIGGFLLMLSLGTNIWVAVAGSIAIAFCSYNFQIITAGHNTKMQAIAYFPWVLAGVIFTYRAALRSFADAQDDKGSAQDDKGNLASWLPKTILGATLFAFALSMQIKANHIQITYYLAIVILAFVIGLFIFQLTNAERRAELKRFFIASALLLFAGVIGIATNANKLIPTYEYAEYTMRGGSELTSDSETHNQNGLNLEYATEWSYGIEEMPNLLIPNFNGGGSGSPLDIDSETGKFFTGVLGQTEAEDVVKSMPTYWGPQPFTAGPMYMGAITIFLFIMGLILCKNRDKWWLLTAIILAVLLSWGCHFMGFTKFWFEHVPMYDKFRTVSMILIVLQVTLPMLGFLALDRIMKQQYEKRQVFMAGGISLALTAGFCLLCILFPDIAGTYSVEGDMSMLSGWPKEYQQAFADALRADRRDLMIADAVRSFFLIVISAGLLVLPYISKTFSKGWGKICIIGSIALVVLFDLWSVGKRYLNEDNFVSPKDFTSHYRPSSVDEAILKDKDLDFRVLSTTGFYSAIPSYHHKCIGGYSAVKLQRYDDLIKRELEPERSYFEKVEDYLFSLYEKEEITVEEFFENIGYIMETDMPVTAMLNGKYVIGKYSYYENPGAFGNCWFVEDYVPAATPDEEIALLGEVDLSECAVIGDDFEWAQRSFADAQDDRSDSQDDRGGDLGDEIYLTHYAPNELRYDFSTSGERAAIFSEVYYPKGWKAWIEPAGTYGTVVDGRYQPTAEAKEVDIFRADWILRGVVIPEGEGTLIMRFEPESYRTGENISRISSILLILLLLGSAGSVIYFTRRKNNSAGA